MKKSIAIIFLCLNFLIFGNKNELNYNIKTIKNHNDFSTIGNVTNWKHGTKDIFTKYNIQVEKVELYDNKVYPVFYVRFNNVDIINSQWGLKIFEEVLKANGYWNYSVIDEYNNSCFEVIGNRKNKILKKVLYNGVETNFGETQENIEDKVYDLVFNLPEVQVFFDNIDKYNKKNNKNVKMVSMIQTKPSSTATDNLDRNYYMVYIGESHETHNVRWNTFYVKKDLTEILIDDIDKGILSLENWRLLKKKRGF